MLKGSQSRVDFRRKDLIKKLSILTAIALPVVAVGAFLVSQSSADAGPGYGGGQPGCDYEISTCAGGSWTYYTAASDSIMIPDYGSTPGGEITQCLTKGGGYWRFALEDSTGTQRAFWGSAASVKNGGGSPTAPVAWIGPPDGTPLPDTKTTGLRGAWDQVAIEFSKVVAAGDNQGMSWPTPANQSSQGTLAWFCAPATWGTTLDSDSQINGLHRGKNNPVIVERGATVTYTHYLTRDPLTDPGAGQYRIFETKYPDQNGATPSSSSMGSQNTPQVLNVDLFGAGANATLNSNYATIPFTIPSDAVNGSIWCQRIEFYASNDLGGHTTDANRGFPTWDGSSTTRGEVCAQVVVPKHTVDSFINGLHQGMTNPVEAERGTTVNFTHTLVRDQVLNPGTGQYRIVETKYPAKDGNLPASSSMTTQNTPQPLTSATFGGTLTATLASNYATIPFTIPSNAVNGSIWCQHIEFWAPNDNNTPPNDSTSNWGYPAWDASSMTKGEVCVTAIVPVHTPDSFVDKTPDGQPDGERGPVYIRPGEDFEFEHRIDKDRPNLNGGMGIYEVNEEVTNGGLSQCIWDPLNNGSIMTNANFAGSPNPFTPTQPEFNSPTYGNSLIDSDHTLVPCTSNPMDPENATYCQNINFWTNIDGNVPQAFDSNKNWGRSEYVCAIVRIPDLKIVKTTAKTDLEVDEEFEYEITVTNTDEFIDTAGLIRVTDSLPEGIAFSSLTETCETIDPEEEGEEPEEVCEDLPPVISSEEMDCEVTGNSSFKCDTTNVLDPQEANSFTIKVRVKAVGMVGKTEFDNRAFVGGGGDRNCPVDNNNLECSDNIIVRIPSLPEPPKTGVVLGASTPDASQDNQWIIISSTVVALSGIMILGFQAIRRNRR